MPPQRDIWRWLGVGGVTLCAAAYVWHAAYFRLYVNDDAYITFRYSLRWAEGHGPYFNDGEHVEGYTNFLLMALMAGVIKVAGVDVVPAAAKLVGVAGGLLALLSAWELCRRWLRKVAPLAAAAPLLACAAPALVAVNAAYALNSVSGLETALFSGWIVLGLLLQQVAHDAGDDRWRGAGVAFALAALTRPEGAVLFAGALTGRVLAGPWRPRRVWGPIVIDAAIVTAAVAGHLVFRYVQYDGELLPNTYYAKAGGMNWAFAPWQYVAAFAQLHLAGPAALVVLLPVVAGRAVLRRATLPTLLVVLAAVAGILRTGADWMIGGRLLVPYVPLWAALAVAGLAAVAERLRWRPRLLAAAGGVALVLLVGRQAEARRAYHDYCAARAEGYHRGHAALADWLRHNAHPGDTVALMDIGIIGFRCPDLRILDITGLTDRHIARAPGEFLDKRYDPAYVLEQHPAFVVLVLTEADLRGRAKRYEGWIPIERRILTHPVFVRHYWRPRPEHPADDAPARIAALAGADGVFEHRYPGKTYLLAVYAFKPG